jgi:hypothetical protein
VRADERRSPILDRIDAEEIAEITVAEGVEPLDALPGIQQAGVEAGLITAHESCQLALTSGSAPPSKHSQTGTTAG